MSAPAVSIVLPSYNGSRYLAESIESCLAQSFTDWELIVVDDASTDETPSIVAAYAAKDPRIRLLRHDSNKKLPAALNTGFAAAKGELLTWTSDDNCYRSNALESLVGFLAAHPETDAVYTDYTVIDDEGAETSRVQVRDPVYLMRENVAGPCFLYRRAVHEGVGSYDEKLFLVEDYDFWLRAAARFRLVPLHQDLYLYRRHQSSLSNLYVPRVLINRDATLWKNLPSLRWLPTRAAVAGWLNLAVTSRGRGEYLPCAKALLRALARSPIQAVLLALGIVREGHPFIYRLTFPGEFGSAGIPEGRE